jgi:hypothetical protein
VRDFRFGWTSGFILGFWLRLGGEGGERVRYSSLAFGF